MPRPAPVTTAVRSSNRNDPLGTGTVSFVVAAGIPTPELALY